MLRYQVHMSEVWVALHSPWNAENIEDSLVYLIIFMKSLKINGIMLRTSCSWGAEQSGMSPRLLRSMAFFPIALFSGNAEVLTPHGLLTLLRIQLNSTTLIQQVNSALSQLGRRHFQLLEDRGLWCETCSGPSSRGLSVLVVMVFYLL